MKETNQIYLPGLNGIRAIAALTVLLGHMFAPFGTWSLPALDLPWPSGPVTTFFVISGFLITYLMLHELDKTGDVSIPKFYVRRILRIWPLYYGYMTIALAVCMWLGFGINSSVWLYGLFSANIAHALSEVGLIAVPMVCIWHYWSLGVEEQFYLFYPWLVKVGKKHLLPVLIIAFLIWFGAKCGAYVFLGKGIVYRILAITAFDCMLIGAIGAVLYKRSALRMGGGIVGKTIRIVLWLLFFTSGLYAKYIPALIRPTYISLISLGVIVSGLVGKPILENKVMSYLGNISYGIYVIHPVLLTVLTYYFSLLQAHFLKSEWVPMWMWYVAIYIIVTGLTIGLAALSYEFYEKPFLKLKKKFMVVVSTNRAE